MNAPNKGFGATQLPKYLIVYLLIVGFGSGLAIIFDFPDTDTNTLPNGTTLKFPDSGSLSALFGLQSNDQKLILLAMLAGMTGSFLHAAQSLVSYMGNGTFKQSWAAWYLLRPWIGGILGLTIYFAFRAGLISGAAGLNPYGVVAIGLLGGWFSKTATDKLQEVFEALFTPKGDENRAHKLEGMHPVLQSIDPSPVPAGVNAIKVQGSDFDEGAAIIVNGKPLKTDYHSNAALSAELIPRPPAGTVSVQVKNPDGPKNVSEEKELVLE